MARWVIVVKVIRTKLVDDGKKSARTTNGECPNIRVEMVPFGESAMFESILLILSHFYHLVKFFFRRCWTPVEIEDQRDCKNDRPVYNHRCMLIEEMFIAWWASKSILPLWDGTIFIQSICKVFARYFHPDDMPRVRSVTGVKIHFKCSQHHGLLRRDSRKSYLLLD